MPPTVHGPSPSRLVAVKCAVVGLAVTLVGAIVGSSLVGLAGPLVAIGMYVAYTHGGGGGGKLIPIPVRVDDRDYRSLR